MSHADFDQNGAGLTAVDNDISNRLLPVLAQFASRGAVDFNPYDARSYVDGYLLAADHLDVPDEMADAVIEALVDAGLVEWTGCDDGICDALRVTDVGFAVADTLRTPVEWLVSYFHAMATAA